MQVMVFFSIHPVGTGTHVGDAVRRAVQIIKGSGLEHEVGASGTTILGEWDAVFGVIRGCHEALGQDDVRLSSLIKVDLKPGLTDGDIRRKVQRVLPGEA